MCEFARVYMYYLFMYRRGSRNVKKKRLDTINYFTPVREAMRELLILKLFFSNTFLCKVFNQWEIVQWYLMYDTILKNSKQFPKMFSLRTF